MKSNISIYTAPFNRRFSDEYLIFFFLYGECLKEAQKQFTLDQIQNTGLM